MRASFILLVVLGLLFAMPIVVVGFSIHGIDLALLAAAAVVLLVFMGPLSFLFASSIASDMELTLLFIIGLFLFLAWLKALTRGPEAYVPYMSVTCWGLLGAYFCVSLYFEHAL